MPDLAATTLSGDLDNPLVITKIERVIVAPKDDKYDE
jgi:hypothetical protein